MNDRQQVGGTQNTTADENADCSVGIGGNRMKTDPSGDPENAVMSVSCYQKDVFLVF